MIRLIRDNSLPPFGLAGSRNLIAAMWQRQWLFTLTGFGMLALLPPVLLAVAIDERTLLGVSVWLKPGKFLLSVGIYLLTLAWFMAYTPVRFQQSPLVRAAVVAVLIASVFEIAYISFQAALGEASHFNVGDPFHAMMYGLMGVGAVTLTGFSLLLGIAVARNSSSPLQPATRWGMALGLMLTFVLGTWSGAVISGVGGHVVGGPQFDGDGLALLGWSTSAGDLRIAHFFGMHALHFLPLLGWLATQLWPRQGIGIVVTGSVIYTGFAVFTLLQALAGKPLV